MTTASSVYPSMSGKYLLGHLINSHE